MSRIFPCRSHTFVYPSRLPGRAELAFESQWAKRKKEGKKKKEEEEREEKGGICVPEAEGSAGLLAAGAA